MRREYAGRRLGAAVRAGQRARSGERRDGGRHGTVPRRSHDASRSALRARWGPPISGDPPRVVRAALDEVGARGRVSRRTSPARLAIVTGIYPATSTQCPGLGQEQSEAQGVMHPRIGLQVYEDGHGFVSEHGSPLAVEARQDAS